MEADDFEERELELELELASPRPSGRILLNLARQTETLRGGATSPFSKITSDLESLVMEMEVDAEAILASKPRPTTVQLAFGKKETIFSQRPSSTIEPPLNDSIISRSLWIGNLDPTLTEPEIRLAFEPFGQIESLRLLPSKECAFVNYFKVEDAMRAREILQGAALGNMIVRIGYGKVDGGYMNGAAGTLGPFTDQFKTLATNGDNNSNILGQSRSVWVGHIGPDMDVDTLCDSFNQFGEIESCRILDARNCAFVNFYWVEDAAKARKAMNGARIGTSIIKTGFAKSTATAGRPEIEAAPIKRVPSADQMRRMDEDENIAISTQEVGPDDFREPVPILPASLQLPEDLNSSVLRECRRRVEHAAATPEEIDQFSKQIMEHMLAASVDPVGNILVQKLIERGSSEVKSQILAEIGANTAAVGVHKNGTWVIQKLINNCRTIEQRTALANHLRPHIVPLLQDQFGNYVVQCCLAYGPAGNQFLFDALYHRCVDIATSRFGSRAMRSCLESPHASVRQMVNFSSRPLANFRV
jgi:RNA recognition motif-containing protein